MFKKKVPALARLAQENQSALLKQILKRVKTIEKSRPKAHKRRGGDTPRQPPSGWKVVKKGAAGPLGIPYDPNRVTEAEVKAAAKAWKTAPCVDGDGGWQEGNIPTEERPITAYLVFALEHAHQDKQLKLAFLRIASRSRSYFNEEPEEILKAKASALNKPLRPALDKYYTAEIAPSGLPTMQYASGERKAGNPPLNQGEHMPFLAGFAVEGEKFTDLYDRTGHIGGNDEAPGYTSDGACMLILTIIGQFLNADFVTACRGAVPEALATLTEVAVKLPARMLGKDDDEHYDICEKHGLPTGSLNLDGMRVGLMSKTPAEQQRVWEAIQKNLQVLRLKNLYTQTADVGAAGLRFGLVNVLYKSDLTYAQMVASPRFDDAVARAVLAENFAGHRGSYLAAVEVLKRMVGKDTALAGRNVTMVAEVQLHLERYVQARKITHLYFKVERSPEWKHFVDDCKQYVNV